MAVVDGVTEAHQFAAIAVIGVTVIVAVVAAWSWLTARRSEGRHDHRFAVDRALLALEALVGVSIVIGALLAVSGERPADPLHLLYAVAAAVTQPAAWWWGGRTDRRHRDASVAAAAVVLLGIEARLFLTG
jgi:cytochrome bd-type quinol oxidase subunit 2